MDKPLPNLPQFKTSKGLKHIQATINSVTLTVEAQAHLRNFILHALGETKDALPDDEWEEWASAIEYALSELGERIALGGWLVGLRRTRMRRIQERAERVAAKKRQITDTSTPRRDEAGSVKGKATPALPSQEEQSYFSLGRQSAKGTVHSLQTTTEPSVHESLKTLRAHAQQTALPNPKPTAKHLLLTVSPPGVIPEIHQADAEEYEFPSSQFVCKFTPGVYTLPKADDVEEDEHGMILYGLDSWGPQPWMSDLPLQIVGGTFSFGGVGTHAQYDGLTKVLRLSVFSYLSTLLEQALLADAHAPLRFPQPPLSPTRLARGSVSIARARSTSHVSKKPDPAVGIWAFLSRKKDNLLQRTAPVRRGSMELHLPLVMKQTRTRSNSPAPPVSEDRSNSSRARRFSFISDYRPSFMQQALKEPEPVQRPFTTALARIEKFKSLLSTSAGVTFDSPDFLVRLAAREKRNPDLRLGGDEKAALMSLLGWEGKYSQGSGMADIAGFVRHQSFSILYSEYIPQPSSSSRPTTPTSSSTPDASSSSSLSVSTPAKQILCGRRRRWLSYRYYSRDGGMDECLGEAITRQCARADELCDEPGCQYKKGEHELRYIHGGVRILVNISRTTPSDDQSDGDDELPEIWESCGACGKQTTRRRMHDASYLLSFAKFLELLVYSRNLCSLSPPLCSHTTPPTRPWSAADSPLPRSRMNIVRHFAVKDRTVTYSLCAVEDIYEVRVPRLQLLQARNSKQEPASEEHQALDGDRRKLRREIMHFWQGLSEHMDTLESNFASEDVPTYHKSLPRLPSADDAYNEFEDDGLITPKGQPSQLPPLPPNTPQTPKSISSNRAFPFPAIISKSDSKSDEDRSQTPETQSGPIPSATSASSASLTLLTHLRHTFQRTEQSLYSELSHTPDSSLNDVRRLFVSAARGATKRLCAWEVKHTTGSSPKLPEAMAQSEPEWWNSGCHAVPGGNVIVREDDWGSIIAFTLSSVDYNKELTNMSNNRTSPTTSIPPPSPTPLMTPSAPDITRSSFFSKTPSNKWFGSSDPLPDPDQDDVCWNEPEAYSAVICRKEHPRDPTSILKLGIPDVLRQKLPDANGLLSGPKSGTPGSSGITVGPRAKADVQISKQAVDGQVSIGSTDRLDKVLQDLEAVSEPGTVRTSSSMTSTSDNRTSASSGFVETNIRRGKASSILSAGSDATISESHTPVPPLPPKDNREGKEESALSTPLEASTPQSMTFAFTNTFSSALKYMLRSGTPPPLPAKHHHALLSTGASPEIDDRPHIKYDWTIGKRLKFSCTVYYAKQFDALRKRCGIDETFLHSLSRSKNWLAEGGKSRSNFWKTADNQFIIKTLVNAWNVADLHVLIELGPAYFRYVDATAMKPTVLAKLLGFYTVEIRNLETGAVQAKADLLVMENLFYKQEIVKTFDLKGIQGRKVKATSNSSTGSKTLFDGDWIEGQQRALTLVQPYSKIVLQEAIKADCEFLAKSNIMDYSLLVGIDESNKQIACGLVDTIGSYTFAKTLEYKAKQGLHSGKEVTVIPPNEYQERFVNAMDNYFVPCPDKWSRPHDDTKIPSDYRQLPSVL